MGHDHARKRRGPQAPGAPAALEDEWLYRKPLYSLDTGDAKTALRTLTRPPGPPLSRMADAAAFCVWGSAFRV